MADDTGDHVGADPRLTVLYPARTPPRDTAVAPDAAVVLDAPPASVVGGDVFFQRAYADAMTLLIEARNYVAYQEHRDSQVLALEDRLLVSQETLRITCRLTQVMAWMFSQRAVQGGEMTLERALSEEFALGGQSVCLEDQWTDDDRLPEAVRSLLDRTHRLYLRVARLETMMRDAA